MQMNCVQEKKKLRRQMIDLRDEIDLTRRTALSQAIAQRVLALEVIATAPSVFCYVSMASEVQTRGLITALLDQNKLVAVPKITDYGQGLMDAHCIKSLNNLTKNKLGAYEPAIGASVSAGRAPDNFDVVLVPGVAFTKSGERLGMGAGFYDRYLAKYKPRWTIGLCFEKQLVDHIPSQRHDIKMDCLLTEQRTLFTSIDHAVI